MFLGGYLTLMIGPTLPVVAPEILTKTIESVSVQESDAGRTGFQVTFAVGRDSFTGIVDYLPVISQLVKVGHRVVLMAVINARPIVLSDGLITKMDLTPSNDPGNTKLTISGTDVSALMDLVELKLPKPAENDAATVLKTLGKYAAVMAPVVIPPLVDPPYPPTERVTNTSGTDLEVVTSLAARHGYVFYVKPGPAPLTNIGYWGPPIPVSPVPQPALTVRAGGASTVTSISFSVDGDQPVIIAGGLVQEKNSAAPVPIAGIPLPPVLSAMDAPIATAPMVRVKQGSSDEGGDVVRAIAMASAEMLKSKLETVKASGELDVGRYGHVLRARKLVGMRGAGLTFDGNWYCESVSHNIARGKYTQSFSLKRDGVIANVPVVRP